MQNNPFFYLSLALAAAILFFFIMWEKEREKNIDLLKQITQLEAVYTIDYVKIKPIIEYRDKKIEIIKEIPIYIGNDCQKELESVKNIINNF